MDFSRLFHALPTPFMVLDRDLRFADMNPSYLAATGRERDELLGQYVFDAFPETPEREATFRDAFERALAGEENELNREPFSIPAEGGGTREVVWRCVQAPLRDDTGAVTHVIQHAVDITAEHEAERRNQIIARELDHRVKNLLAVISSIGRQTAKASTTVEGFLDSFGARLDAIARTHSLLARGQWQGASLAPLIESELAAYGGGTESAAMTVSGPPLFLRPREAQALSMALHELATNAAKHGALSHPDGRLSVSWEHMAEGGFRLVWQESGLKATPAPGPAGFGSMIIDKMTPSEFHGTTERTFTADGMVWTLTAPAR